MNAIRSILNPTVLSCVSGALKEKLWSISRSNSNIHQNFMGIAFSYFFDIMAISEYKTVPSLLRYQIVPLGLIAWSGGLVKKYTKIDFDKFLDGVHLSLIAGNLALDKNTPVALTRFAIWAFERNSDRFPPIVKKISRVAFKVMGGYALLNQAIILFDKKAYFKLGLLTILVTLNVTGVMQKWHNKMQAWAKRVAEENERARKKSEEQQALLNHARNWHASQRT